MSSLSISMASSILLHHSHFQLCSFNNGFPPARKPYSGFSTSENILQPIKALTETSSISIFVEPQIDETPSEEWKKRLNCTPFSDFLNSTCGSGGERVELINRRQVLLSSVGSIAGCLIAASYLAASPAVAASSRSGFTDMPALRGKDYGKTKMRYPDYTETESGLQFKDLRIGTGPTPQSGETVVVDWDGYTIGYYGRIFEARNKTKGGSFEGDDKDFFKFKIGSQVVIPAFEEAVLGMSLGGIRRVIVPPELGYPENDYNKKGPKPTTFSGQRALDFVLRNQGLIDKTLLFDIELLKIIPN